MSDTMVNYLKVIEVPIRGIPINISLCKHSFRQLFFTFSYSIFLPKGKLILELRQLKTQFSLFTKKLPLLLELVINVYLTTLL
jgi:hypothetical protein